MPTPAPTTASYYIAKDGLRYNEHTNSIDANCPFTWQAIADSLGDNEHMTLARVASAIASLLANGGELTADSIENAMVHANEA